MLLLGTVAAGTFCATSVLSQRSEATKYWLLSMPELEASQRANPDNPLFTSEFWDPRVPPSSMIDPAFDPARPSMLRDILACRPWMVVFDPQYRLGSGTQMPVRYEIAASEDDDQIEGCLHRLLPAGYSLTSLSSEQWRYGRR